MIRRLLPGPDDEPLDDAALDIAYAWPGGPWLRANFAVSADGAVEVDGRSGTLGGPHDRRLFARLRAGADVVLVGSGTVRAENYGAVRTASADRVARAERGQHAAVPVAVLTNRAELRPDARLFRESAEAGTAVLVLTSSAAPAGARRALGSVAEVVVCGDGEVDGAAVLEELGARGLQRVLCEGGPTVLGRLLRRGLLDELCLTTAPLLAGPGHTQLVGGGPLEQPPAMRLTQLLGSGDGTLFARYEMENRWRPTSS